jgi:hypothetical protein
LGHGSSDGSHRTNTYKPGSPYHALRNFRCIGVQLNRLEGMSKIGMVFDIILKNLSLPYNFLSDGIKPAATDAEDRLAVSESSVGSFLAH